MGCGLWVVFFFFLLSLSKLYRRVVGDLLHILLSLFAIHLSRDTCCCLQQKRRFLYLRGFLIIWIRTILLILDPSDPTTGLYFNSVPSPEFFGAFNFFWWSCSSSGSGGFGSFLFWTEFDLVPTC